MGARYQRLKQCTGRMGQRSAILEEKHMSQQAIKDSNLVAHRLAKRTKAKSFRKEKGAAYVPAKW